MQSFNPLEKDSRAPGCDRGERVTHFATTPPDKGDEPQSDDGRELFHTGSLWLTR
jgi:hypothetical protein